MLPKEAKHLLEHARMHAEMRRQDADLEAELNHVEFIRRTNNMKPRIVAKDIFMDIEIDTVPRRWRTWVTDDKWVNELDERHKGGYVSGDADESETVE